MKKAITLAIAIACIAAMAFASEDWRGNNRLSGFVVDKNTGKPVPDAKIQLRIQKGAKGGPDGVADKNGRWAFLGLGSGSWNMDVEAPGYVTRQFSNIPIAEGARIPPMKIEMEPQQVQQAAPTTTAEPPHEEVRVNGQVIAKDIADAIDAGNAALTAKNYKEAIANFQKASAVLPTLLPLKLALARAYDGAGDRANAIATMAQVYQADPTNTQNAGIYYDMLIAAAADSMNKNKPSEATPYLDKAIAVNANNEAGYYYRGLAAIQAGKLKNAQPDLEKVVALAPTSEHATEAKEYLDSIRKSLKSSK